MRFVPSASHIFRAKINYSIQSASMSGLPGWAVVSVGVSHGCRGWREAALPDSGGRRRDSAYDYFLIAKSSPR